jgi:hypothetical protein
MTTAVAKPQVSGPDEFSAPTGRRVGRGQVFGTPRLAGTMRKANRHLATLTRPRSMQ